MIVDMAVPIWVYPVLIWTIVWKAIGAWKAARKEHLVWFVSFFIINTVGILPIIYIFFFQHYKFSNKVRKKITKRYKKIPSLV